MLRQGGIQLPDREHVPKEEDWMDVGKGIRYGLLFGTILWGLIIAGFVLWLR